MSYRMAVEDDQIVIRRADSSRVFTIKPKDREFAEEILANLISGVATPS